MFKPASRPVYSVSQLTRYLNHIRLPQRHHPIIGKPARDLPEKEQLDLLSRLHRYTLASVPWENLSKFYTPSPTPVSALLGPGDLFQKIVGEEGRSNDFSSRVGGLGGGRGGGCLETNTFFGNVLNSLGFNVYLGGGRINMKGRFTGWGHAVNLVTIGQQKYLVDAGYGSPGPIQPYPLVIPKPGEEAPVTPYFGPASTRIVYEPIADHSNSTQRLWQYQFRSNRPDAKVRNTWIPIYAFTDMEFIPADLIGMTTTSTFLRQSAFNYTILCVRMVLKKELPEILPNQPFVNDGLEDDAIVGTLILNDKECRIRTAQGKTVLHRFRSDDCRHQCLMKYFGIQFSPAELMGIAGTAPAFQNFIPI